MLSHQKPPGSGLRNLDAEILAAWLNLANGAFAPDRDRHGQDRHGRHPVPTVLANAEAVRLNPASTKKQIIEQRELLRRVNSGAA